MNTAINSKILLVEDDEGLVNTIVPFLEDQGFMMDAVSRAGDVDEALQKSRPDLIILDRKLPDGDGLDIIRDINQSTDIRIILLTGMDDPIEKIVGLELGADDYITKPFHMREFLARVRTVLRRSSITGNHEHNNIKKIKTVVFLDWKYDLSSGDLTSPKTKNIHLTGAEQRLLNCLIENANNIVSKDTISSITTNRDWNPEDRSIDVLVSGLRKKLDDDPRKPTKIRTLRNMGYVFIAPVKRI